jgi:D-alanyl-lipoteichoic acid acyltransferase DltB (MBOAT superfamily)
MTLSRWLRDYLYIPLGGSRTSRLLTYRNLMITMLLGGLWHGAQWTFVAWGAVHGCWLILERAAGPFPIPAALRWLVTFHVVILAWVLFRSPSFAHAADIFTGLATAPTGIDDPNLLAWAIIIAAIGVQFQPLGAARILFDRFVKLDPLIQGTALACWVLLVTAVSPPGVQPFIYYQF